VSIYAPVRAQDAARLVQTVEHRNRDGAASRNRADRPGHQATARSATGMSGKEQEGQDGKLKAVLPGFLMH
jgi:hypothetical protein